MKDEVDNQIYEYLYGYRPTTCTNVQIHHVVRELIIDHEKYWFVEEAELSLKRLLKQNLIKKIEGRYTVTEARDIASDN